MRQGTRKQCGIITVFAHMERAVEIGEAKGGRRVKVENQIKLEFGSWILN